MKCPVAHEIPGHLAHLATFHGLPVPFTVVWENGEPDFRVIDPERVRDCFAKKLCAVCGRRLGDFAYFVGGPESKKNRLFVDPAMHKNCAEYAARMCPFLNGSTKSYSSREPSMPTRKNAMTTVRPNEIFILQAKTRKITMTECEGEPYITVPGWVGWKVSA